jgi:C4-type Zn-finger protein
MTNDRCPDCSKILSRGSNLCTCGWFSIVQIKSASVYQCQYREKNTRCENEGTVSKSTRGNVWFCRGHAHTKMFVK